MRFEYLFKIIGKSTMGFLTGQSWRVLKPWYTGGGPEQRFFFTNGLNQKFSSVGGASYITLSALQSSDFGFAHQKYIPTELLFEWRPLNLACSDNYFS